MRLTADTFAYCRTRAAALEHDLDQRVPHPRGRLHGGAGDRLHPGQRHRLRARRRWPPGWRWTSSAPGCRSSSTRTTTSWRRWPSSGPPGACGRASCASASGPARSAPRCCASTPRPGARTLTAQQPENNIVRVALQVLSAALGGAQSIHSNGYDEALALPTEQSAKLALRTQQVIAAETGITDTVDPLGGSWFIERLTAELEGRARGPHRRDRRPRRARSSASSSCARPSSESALPPPPRGRRPASAW